MHDVASPPARTSTLTVVDLFIAFTIFENIMVRSRSQSSIGRGIPVNYRDYRVLFPSPVSPLWIAFAERLQTRIGLTQIGVAATDKEAMKAVGTMLGEFIKADHPSLIWTTPFVEFRKVCWVDQETDRFFPKNDYVVNGKGKAKLIEVRILFPYLFAKMHTVAEEMDGFLEYIIP